MKYRETRGNNILTSFIYKRWLFGCLLFFLFACAHTSSADNISSQKIKEDFHKIDSAKPLIKSGDLIFRDGTDEVSRAARSFNRLDTTFSHCGLILVENDTVFVYHAIGGKYNPSGRLRRDPIDSFCSPPESDKFAVYRYNLKPRQQSLLADIIHQHYTAGLQFDLYFNFLSDDEMYCSEFVFKCLNKSLSDSLSRDIKAREWPYGISPDDLFLNARSQLVKRVDFIP